MFGYSFCSKYIYSDSRGISRLEASLEVQIEHLLRKILKKKALEKSSWASGEKQVIYTYDIAR